MIDDFLIELNRRKLAGLNDREEWLEARRLGLGGSDAAAVLGWSPWASPWSLWLDKTGAVPLDDGELHEAATWGVRLEAVVAEAYADRTGHEVIDAPGVYQHREHYWMLASPDRLLMDDEHDGPGYLEIKTTSAFKAEDWADGEVPLHYLAQWQHVAAVLGVTWGAFAALIGGNRLVIREMEYDPGFVKMLTSAEAEFWHEHVEAEVPPAMDGQDTTTELLTKLFTDSDPEGEVELDDNVARAVVDYHQSSEAEKEAREFKALSANRLREALGEAEQATYMGVPVATWKASTRKTFDERAHAREHPECHEKFTSQVPTRTLRPGRSKAAKEALARFTEGDER